MFLEFFQRNVYNDRNINLPWKKRNPGVTNSIDDDPVPSKYFSKHEYEIHEPSLIK